MCYNKKVFVSWSSGLIVKKTDEMKRTTVGQINFKTRALRIRNRDKGLVSKNKESESESKGRNVFGCNEFLEFLKRT